MKNLNIPWWVTTLLGVTGGGSIAVSQSCGGYFSPITCNILTGLAIIIVGVLGVTHPGIQTGLKQIPAILSEQE